MQTVRNIEILYIQKIYRLYHKLDVNNIKIKFRNIFPYIN